jgi:hypothetical protein
MALRSHGNVLQPKTCAPLPLARHRWRNNGIWKQRRRCKKRKFNSSLIDWIWTCQRCDQNQMLGMAFASSTCMEHFGFDRASAAFARGPSVPIAPRRGKRYSQIKKNA